MSATATPPAKTLTIFDRCDKCGAQAWIRATLAEPLPNGSVGRLYFCAHHSRQVSSSLRPKCVHWLDESEHLNKKPSSSAAAK